LLLQPVVDHITKVFAVALLQAEEQHRPPANRSAVAIACRSAAPDVAESHSVEVSKCIYTRLGWPARNGGLEQAFIHWAQADGRCWRFARSAKTATLSPGCAM
jgi:type III restriction enzyme